MQPVNSLLYTILKPAVIQNNPEQAKGVKNLHGEMQKLHERYIISLMLV